MTRIDERGPPVVLDEADRGRLAHLFASREVVVAAYLFGSQATGKAGPLSDVDLAVWLDPEMARSPRSRRALDLAADAGGLLGTDEIQVVALNDAAARQRNVLVHIYQDVDHEQIWETLGELDRFREFAAAAQKVAGSGSG